MKTALLLLALLTASVLPAFDRNKTADELENIRLSSPAKTAAKRSYPLKKGCSYAVSAVISGSHDNVAHLEVRLFKGKEQTHFFRSLRNSTKAERLALVFNAGGADRAEISCMLLQDAIAGCTAEFKEYRVVCCDNTIIQPWDKRGPSHCRRVISENGDITLYPGGSRVPATFQTNINLIMPDTRMRFSADVKAEYPNAAMLQVHCSGGKEKYRGFRSKWNSKKQETLVVDFDTAQFKHISLTLRCANGKKFKNKPVTFSNITLEIPSQKTKQH